MRTLNLKSITPKLHFHIASAVGLLALIITFAAATYFTASSAWTTSSPLWAIFIGIVVGVVHSITTIAASQAKFGDEFPALACAIISFATALWGFDFSKNDALAYTIFVIGAWAIHYKWYHFAKAQMEEAQCIGHQPPGPVIDVPVGEKERVP